ncbi:MAG TPA: LLM class flavin-dependent oxidoreductase [Pseudomonadales bacterium]|nr:LLM class flavin-dependent oxidoreductase [Pseudomonadales bacterium]
MQFGIFDHLERRDADLATLYEQRLQMLEFADAAGFARYHKAEHHFTPLDAAPSGTVFLAAASQRTQRIRLGTLVSLLPFYHPVRFVEEVCALDHLTRGRLDLGVGKGISPIEHRLWGHADEQAMPRTLEAIEILRKGLTLERLTHAGEFHRFEELPMVLAPLQQPHPPLWYPGNIEFAGARRLNTVVGGPIPAVKAQVARYRELVAAATVDWNPGVATPTIGATRHVYVAPTRAAAHARARAAWQRYDENLSKLWRAHGTEPIMSPSLKGNFDLAIGAQVLLADTPEAVCAHVEALRAESGTDYFVGAFAWGDLTHAEVMASLRLFADGVVTPLRG